MTCGVEPAAMPPPADPEASRNGNERPSVTLLAQDLPFDLRDFTLRPPRLCVRPTAFLRASRRVAGDAEEELRARAGKRFRTFFVKGTFRVTGQPYNERSGAEPCAKPAGRANCSLTIG